MGDLIDFVQRRAAHLDKAEDQARAQKEQHGIPTEWNFLCRADIYEPEPGSAFEPLIEITALNPDDKRTNVERLRAIANALEDLSRILRLKAFLHDPNPAEDPVFNATIFANGRRKLWRSPDINTEERAELLRQHVRATAEMIQCPKPPSPSPQPASLSR